MIFIASAIAFLASSSVARATPLSFPTLLPRILSKPETKISCDSFGSLSTGPYTIYHNNWGASKAQSGSQCTYFTSLKDGSVAWSTKWSWSGGPGIVKSYSNVALEHVNKQISSVGSIPSTWKWMMTGDHLVSDVSYDLWLSGTRGGGNKFEIMVWLAAYGGARPISKDGKAIAQPQIGGKTWSLFTGPNGNTTVFSFVAGTPVTDWCGDMLDFLQYLVKNEGISSTNWITSLQGGTEPFSGTNAEFTTSAYSMLVEDEQGSRNLKCPKA